MVFDLRTISFGDKSTIGACTLLTDSLAALFSHSFQSIRNVERTTTIQSFTFRKKILSRRRPPLDHRRSDATNSKWFFEDVLSPVAFLVRYGHFRHTWTDERVRDERLRVQHGGRGDGFKRGCGVDRFGTESGVGRRVYDDGITVTTEKCTDEIRAGITCKRCWRTICHGYNSVVEGGGRRWWGVRRVGRGEEQ